MTPKAAYVRSSQSLHYIDMTRNQCIEIIMDDGQMHKFDSIFKLACNHSRKLTEEELGVITSITGHQHDGPDLSSICLWVPASIHHEVEKGYTYTVYGGVQIAGNINRSNSGGLLSKQVFNQNNARMSSSAIQGGSYRDVRRTNVGGQVHHIPSDYASNIPYKEGPTIWMTTEDHKKTGSCGASGRDYRTDQKQLINAGRIRDAIAMDIRDVRSNFGTKYNEGLLQMLQYARKQGYIQKPVSEVLKNDR